MYRIYKLVFLILTVVFCCNNSAFAQKRASIGLSYDVGVSTYFFVYDININNDIIGNNFIRSDGIGLVFTYTDNLVGVQIGAKRIPKGWVERFKNGVSHTFKMDCIEVPIMTHMRFSRLRKSGLILNYGLFVSKAFDHKITLDSIMPDPTLDTLYINYENPVFNEFDYGIKAGIGYEIEFGKHNLQLQLMYTQGMRDLFEPDRVKLYRSLSQTITASVIYKFSFYKKMNEKDLRKLAALALQKKQKKDKKQKAKSDRKQKKADKKEAKKIRKQERKEKKEKKEKNQEKTKNSEEK